MFIIMPATGIWSRFHAFLSMLTARSATVWDRSPTSGYNLFDNSPCPPLDFAPCRSISLSNLRFCLSCPDIFERPPHRRLNPQIDVYFLPGLRTLNSALTVLQCILAGNGVVCDLYTYTP